MITRRGLITGIATFLAAPAIVRAGSLMPVKALPDPMAIIGVTDWGMGHMAINWRCGEPIDVGDLVRLGADGKVYRIEQTMSGYADYFGTAYSTSL